MSFGVLVLAGCWLLILTVLVLDLAGVLHRGTGYRWQATGVLIINSAVGAIGFAHLHHWSGTLESTTWPVVLAGFAIFIVGLVVQTRQRRKADRVG
jgi:hypothetical protein